MSIATDRPSYRKWLADALKAKQSKNASYSLRMFAKNLEIGIATLSSVINEKRHLSRKNIELVAKKLEWTNEQIFSARLEIQSHTRKAANTSSGQIKLSAAPHLCSWLHLLLLNLAEIDSCPSDVSILAKLAGSEESFVSRALGDLEDEKLIVESEGAWRRTERQIVFGHMHLHPLADEIRAQMSKAMQHSPSHERVVKNASVALVVSGGDTTHTHLLKHLTKASRQLQKSIGKSKNKDTIYAVAIEVTPILRR